MNLPYNPEDKESILEYAKLLKGKTLRESCDSSILAHNYAGKGNFGQILEAEKVWVETKKIVSKGEIVSEVKDNIRYTNFPKKSFNTVSHVRPHAKNAADTYPLPVKDKLTQVNEYTKHCFWLNNTYIRDEIYLKQD